MPWYVWIISGLSMLYSMTVWQYRPPMQTAPPTPVTAPEPLPVALYVPPALATPPANIEAEKLADAVWGMNSTGRRKGEFTADDAYKLALTATSCELDPYLFGGLASFESGFRTAAVSPSGRHFGLYQVHASKVAHDVVASTNEACTKLLAWKRECAKRGHTLLADAHSDFLAHWFSGNKVNAKAIANAREVRRRADMLRERARVDMATDAEMN